MEIEDEARGARRRPVRRFKDWAYSAAPFLLAAYLLVPTLFKAWLQPFSPIDLTILLAVPTASVGVLWLVDHRRSLSNHERTALLLWSALTALIALGVLWSADQVQALEYAASWIALAALPLLAGFVVAATESLLRRFLVTVLAAGCLVIALGLFTMPTVDAGVLELLETNRLGVARVALLAPAIAIPLIGWTGGGYGRVFAVVLVPLATFVAVATGSRAAIFVFALMSLLLVGGALWRSSRRSDVARLGFASALGVLLLFAAAGSWLPSDALARFGLLGEAVMEPVPSTPTNAGGSPRAGATDAPPPPEAEEPVGGESVAARLELVSESIEIFKTRPILGAGTGGFAATAATTPGLEPYKHPHNLLLQFATDFGLVGLAMIGSLSLVAAARLWRLATPVRVALGLVFGFLAVNALFSNGIYENRMLWGIWLLLLALDQETHS